MFFKEWEKNVKTGENLEAFFKKLLLTVENNLQPKDHALPVTLADEAIASGETLTGLWL
jgi:archaeosine-15-forming tRNA-guanine transglycosylase